MRRSVIIVLAVFSALLFVTCSDDDNNPTTATTPCDDPDVVCATVTVFPSDVDLQEAYTSTGNETATFGWYDVDNSTIEGYAPGKRVIITLDFQPPLRVTATYPFDLSFQVVGPSPTCNEHGFAPVSAEIKPNGTWPGTTNVFAEAWRECTTGVSSFQTQIDYNNVLRKGHVLRTLTLEFTVPETYTDGDGAGSPVLPGDPNIRIFFWQTRAVGDHRGDPPVVQSR